ncbi:hypothetical protein C8R47DRAFT_1205777 [Mycena vitilis]|nr:hypothetical protein C8R47DRAFT_1205777 [Mycena vitilis]
MEPPPLLQNGLVLGIPPANAPDPNYPACSAKFFPDLAFAGLQKYESAEQAPPEFAIYAFYFFLPTPKDGRVFTTAIQAEEAAKELGISTSRISVHRRLLPTCNAIYSWCKESHGHPTPERCSDRRKRQLGSTLTTYDTDLQKERIRRYQNEYGVVPPPPHVHRQRERKRVVLLGPLDAEEAAADTLAAWKGAGAVSPSPPSPEIARAAAARAMKAADRGVLLWDSPQYQEPLPAVPVPAAKRSAPAEFADLGFQPEAPMPMSIKRRRFQPAPSSSGALAQKTLPSSDRVLGADEGPSCYVLLTTPSKKAAAPAASSKSAAPAASSESAAPAASSKSAAPATSSKNDAAPSAGPRGWFVLSNGEIFESGAEAEKTMLSENVNAKFVQDLESARAWLISIAK